MRFATTGCLAAVPLAMQLANASPTPYSYGDHGMMTMNGLLGRQSEDEFDVHDLSFIKRIAAVGDSYSAGIGAGERLGTVFEALDPTSGQCHESPSLPTFFKLLTLCARLGLQPLLHGLPCFRE